jgi:FeS assembly SUF system protein
MMPGMMELHVEKTLSDEMLERILALPEEEQINATLRTVYDPEIPVNIMELGLIYDVGITEGIVAVEMTLTAPACPVAGDIVEAVKKKLEMLPHVNEAKVELVWDPPWTPERMSDAAKLELGVY